MKVSCIIPTRNQARFLRGCLDRCLGQRGVELEVIVVDGLSTDGTPDILRSYGPRVRWVSEADRGQSDAVNKGVAMAGGPIIAWINSDDYYPHDGVLSRVAPCFAQDPDLEIVYGDGQWVDPAGRMLRRYPSRTLPSRSYLLTRPSSFVMQPAVFFTRALFDRVGGLAADLHWTLDYDLWLRMFPQARKTQYIPEILACATRHAGAKSRRGMREQIRETVAVKKRYAREYNLNGLDRVRLRLGIARLYVYAAAVQCRLWDAG